VNVTHVVPYMHPNAGGPPVVVDRLCRRLAARGNRVRVLTTDALAGGDTGWEREYTDGGYELDVHRTGGGGAFAYSRTFAQAVRTAAAASDLVHLHTIWTYPTLRAAWVCRKLGIPYMVMPHGMLDPNSVRRKRVKKWLYAKLVEGPNLRRAAGLVYTHTEEERLARQTVSGLPRGWIVPLAADEPPVEDRAELAAEFFAQHGNFAGTRVVLFLGRLHPKKGLDLLIPAFAEVVRRVPEARLVLVGPGDPQYVAGLRARAAELGLGERVSFLGPLAGRAKWAALAAATAFALPSYQENFAITVVEAMSIGTPVLLSQRINIWAEVESARAGVISTLDTTGIADSLEMIVGNAARANELGSNGRSLVQRTYNWDRTADATELAYRSALIPAPPELITSGDPSRASHAAHGSRERN
jgi:glycosyltransferase involved in cell wall biosynthesis